MSFTPTPEFIHREFEDVIRDDVFRRAQLPEGGRPVLVLLGGQPAAGKSNAQNAIIARSPEANLVGITGDDFRSSHPDFEELALNDPLRMTEVTGAVSGPLVRECLDYAKEQGYSVLLEGVFSNQEMVVQTAEEFSKAGYDVQVCAMAVSEDVSRLSAESRYLQDIDRPRKARWTPPAAHDAAVVNGPGTVAALEASPYVSRVEVWSRDRQLYVNDRDRLGQWEREPEAAQVLMDERARPIEDPKEWLDLYEVNATRAEEHIIGRGVGNAPEPYLKDDRAHEVWQTLTTTAAVTMIPAVFGPEENPEKAQARERVQDHGKQIDAVHDSDITVVTQRTRELPETTQSRAQGLAAKRENVSAQLKNAKSERTAQTAQPEPREISELKHRPGQNLTQEPSHERRR